MRTRIYHPPPLRPQTAAPEPVPEPPSPWRAAERTWLDVLDGNDHIVLACDGWEVVMDVVLTGSLRPGKYRVDDATGRRVAELVVDGPGQWRIYSARPARRGR